MAPNWMQLLLCWALAGAACDAAGAAPSAHATPPAYTMQPAGCAGIGADLYIPAAPLRHGRAPPVVAMLPGLAMPSAALRPYAHVFASNGIAALALDGTYAPPRTGALSQQPLPLLRRHARARALGACLRALGVEGLVDAAAVAFWGAEHGAAAAAEAALLGWEGPFEGVFIQVRQRGWSGPTRMAAGVQASVPAPRSCTCLPSAAGSMLLRRASGGSRHSPRASQHCM